MAVRGGQRERGEGIIIFGITLQPVFFFFYKNLETGEKRHTTEYVSSDICEVLEEIGSGKIFALLTDNVSNMKVAWDNVMDKYPRMTAIGCASHGLNLLFGHM